LSDAYEVAVLPRLTINWDWAAAESSVKRALELNPNSATAHNTYAELLIAQGRVEEAVRESEISLRFDPTSLQRMRDHARTLSDARRLDEAEALARKGVALAPLSILGRRTLGGILNARGKYDEAIVEFTYQAERGGLSNVPIGLGIAYAHTGRRADAERVIAERKKLLGRGGSNYYGLAVIYAALGEKDQAFEWLEKSWQEQEVAILYLKQASAFVPLRTDPRFAEMMRRIGLRP
jgi:tetratricopeptide (TPR) repeat protein